ncbi:MAG: DUF58 domain-containing protein [Planctomycetota bacterium]|nr:DUF58 domain-containing protein [Planctomycetota bacterium]
MSVENYLKPEVIKQIASLDLKAKFIVEGFLSGMHGSWKHGFSVEFSEYRRYIPGDDPRAIDWNAYARTDRHYIKLFQAETSLEGYLAMDISASMDYGTTSLTKLEYGIALAAAMGFLMINQKDSVGLFTFDEKVRALFPAKSKKLHLTRIIGELARSQPGGKTEFLENCIKLAAFVRHRSLIILFSDLIFPFDEFKKGLSILRHSGHDVILFHILDSAEREFPFDDPVEMEDPETGEKTAVSPDVARKGYLEAIEKFTESVETECSRQRADYVPIDTSTPFNIALTSFLVRRSRR